MEIKIEKLRNGDIRKIAKIASENFSGLKHFPEAVLWIKSNFKAFPRMQYFVVKSGKEIFGYILWQEKGGFRKNSVWELEQIAVAKNFQGQGIGISLITQSLERIKEYLQKRGASLKLIEVTTGAENRAQKLYRKTINAEEECRIKDFFRGDEVIMIARFDKS